MKKGALVFALLLTLPGTLRAYGPHDNECIDCHGIHTAEGGALIGVEPFEPENPSTGTLLSDSSALCLGCHSDQGGILEIDLMRTHPIGIAPKRAMVPPENLSPEGTMTCTSCHDPHPSNPNYMYLKGEVSGPGDMGSFCEICHSDKRER